MNYGNEILLGTPALRARFTGGLVTPDVATRGGVFGPQGYGGGIFDGSTALSGVALGAVEWKNEDADAGVAAVQIAANGALRRLGYTTINEDGILGGRTCGAISVVAEKGTAEDFQKLASVARMGEVLAVCDAHGGDWVRPGKAGAAPGPQITKKNGAPPVARRAGGGIDMTTVGLLVLFAGGAAYLWTRKRRR